MTSMEAIETRELRERLTAFLEDQLPAGAVEVTSLHRSGAGSSRENWPFDATWTEGGQRRAHRLLLRRDPPAGVVDTDRETERKLLRALEGSPLPAPRVLWADSPGVRLERPCMILERAPGTTHRHMLTDKDPLGLGDQRRVALARHCCELLADVHTLDMTALGLDRVLGALAPDTGEHEVRRWERVIERDALEPQPGLRLVAQWLRQHVPPPPERRALVHGDYRPANALVVDGDITALLDWEFAHLGDPLEDVGWYCTPVYRHDHFIPGSWEESDFVQYYTERNDMVVDLPALRFWQVLAMYKLAALALTGIRIFVQEGAHRPASPVEGFVRTVLAATRDIDLQLVHEAVA